MSEQFVIFSGQKSLFMIYLTHIAVTDVGICLYIVIIEAVEEVAWEMFSTLLSYRVYIPTISISSIRSRI
jgi:hypothetical protein